MNVKIGNFGQLKKAAMIGLWLVGMLISVGCLPILGSFEVGYVEAEPSGEQSAQNGVVSGAVCFYGELTPEITLYFQETESAQVYQFLHDRGKPEFKTSLPAGTYKVFAAAPTGLIGTYSEAVLCGLGESCSDHTPRSFPVVGGRETDHIFVCDWMLPPDVLENFPLPRPSEPDIRVTEPAPTVPAFSPLIYFAEVPDLAKAQRVFPAGVREVFSMWEYTNMVPGAVVRRVWYFDGGIWLTREETWDYDRYGAVGIMTDVSVFDYDAGLPAGTYWLQLYIDGVEQTDSENIDLASFILAPTETLPAMASPDRQMTAFVDPPGTLVLENQTGNQSTLLLEPEISGFSWYPDSQYILYSVRDRSDQELHSLPARIVDQIWAANVTSGSRQRLETAGLSVHTLGISPTGRYLAALGGTGWEEDCYADYQFGLIDVTPEFEVNNLLSLVDFMGVPDPTEAYVDKIIGWKSDTEFLISIKWRCRPQNISGVYVLDVTTRIASRESVLDSWILYSNPYFNVSLRYPAEWEFQTGSPQNGEHFGNPDGFFAIRATAGRSLDDLARRETEQLLLPYGTQPTIETLEIQGNPARLILPSADQSPDLKSQSVLIIQLPQPLQLEGDTYGYLMLFADRIHIYSIIQTLAFAEG